MDDDDAYLVWSNEHGAWWRPGEAGYTRNLAEAGRYSRDRALAICRSAIPTALHIGAVAELPVRLADVDAFLEGERVPFSIRETRK
jgi:hypothetical protein